MQTSQIVEILGEAEFEASTDARKHTVIFTKPGKPRWIIKY
jgi:hypothetical protein